MSLVITKDIPKALKCKIEGSHTGWEGLRGLGVTNVGKIPSFFLETVPISVDISSLMFFDAPLLNITLGGYLRWSINILLAALKAFCNERLPLSEEPGHTCPDVRSLVKREARPNPCPFKMSKGEPSFLIFSPSTFPSLAKWAM